MTHRYKGLGSIGLDLDTVAAAVAGLYLAFTTPPGAAPATTEDTMADEPVFKDITSEEYREYFFPGDAADAPSVCIKEPMSLNVSASGGHRIVGSDGLSYYIPAGWRMLRWKPKPGKKSFEF